MYFIASSFRGTRSPLRRTAVGEMDTSLECRPRLAPPPGGAPKEHRGVAPPFAGEPCTGIANRGRASLGKALPETGETLPTSGSLRYSQAAETTVRRVTPVSGS